MTKKISPSLVKEAIMAEAKAIKRKREIYEEIKKMNTELAALNEVGMVGSFGFATPNDVSNKTKTGFVGTQDLSHVKELMDSMKAEEKPSEEAVMEALKEENESLKRELDELKNQKIVSA